MTKVTVAVRERRRYCSGCVCFFFVRGKLDIFNENNSDLKQFYVEMWDALFTCRVI